MDRKLKIVDIDCSLILSHTAMSNLILKNGKCGNRHEPKVEDRRLLFLILWVDLWWSRRTHLILLIGNMVVGWGLHLVENQRRKERKFRSLQEVNLLHGIRV